LGANLCSDLVTEMVPKLGNKTVPKSDPKSLNKITPRIEALNGFWLPVENT